MKDALRTIVFWTAMWLWTAICFLILTLAVLSSTLIGLKNRDRIAHKIAELWSKVFFNIVPGWSTRIEGSENLPSKNQPVVYVSNHQSVTDIWAIYLLGTQFRWLSKEEVFKVPIIGQAMKWAGYIPIKRGEKDSMKEAMQRSGEWLQSGISMFFFPEGTRSETLELRPFKIGAFRLAAEHQCPVSPIVLKGTGKLMRKGSMVPNSAHIEVEVLPLQTIKPGESYEDFAARVRGMISSRL